MTIDASRASLCKGRVRRATSVASWPNGGRVVTLAAGHAVAPTHVIDDGRGELLSTFLPQRGIGEVVGIFCKYVFDGQSGVGGGYFKPTARRDMTVRAPSSQSGTVVFVPRLLVARIGSHRGHRMTRCAECVCRAASQYLRANDEASSAGQRSQCHEREPRQPSLARHGIPPVCSRRIRSALPGARSAASGPDPPSIGVIV